MVVYNVDTVANLSTKGQRSKLRSG